MTRFAKRRGIYALILVLLGLVTANPRRLPPAASGGTLRPDSVALLPSASLRGSLDPASVCGCCGKGGLARRKWAYDALRREGTPEFALDAGDFAPRIDEESAFEKGAFMARALGQMGCRVWTPGEGELAFGRARLLELVRQGGMAVVSANLLDAAGTPLFPDRYVTRLGRLRVGVTGVTDSQLLDRFPVGFGAAQADFDCAPAAEALRPVVAELRRSCDRVVVLAHMTLEAGRLLAAEVSGIDIMVLGHDQIQIYESAPEFVNGALILRIGKSGEQLARVHLPAVGCEPLPPGVLSLSPLTDETRLDAPLQAAIDSLGRQFKERRSELRRHRAASRVGALGGESYLGVGLCARCHADIAARWAETRHANAHGTLIDAGRHREPECLRCHVTGFGQPGGFVPEKYDLEGEAIALSGGLLRGVQCEACHGMGTRHGTGAGWAKPEEAVCRSCHDADNDPDFDYAGAMAAGVHGKAGEGESTPGESSERP